MGNRLLLADDSITIQKVVGIIFANEDYDLTVVDNGVAALDKARGLVPDIILIDALMPGKNGYEVCEEVRRDPALRHIPLLLLTGAFEPFDEERARQCGADDFISKPFESQHLIDKVGALIAQGKERAKTRPEPVVAEPAPQPPEAPVATAREKSPAVPEETVLMTKTSGDEIVGDFFAVEEEGGEDIVSAELTVAEEVIEVSPDEDIWGAFDVEEVPAEEAFAFEETSVATPVEAAAGLTAEEEFFFAEEVPDPTGAGTVQFAAPLEFIPPEEPAAEDFFSFAEEPSPAEAETKVAPQGKATEEDIFAFVEEASAPTEVAAELLAVPQEFIPPLEPAQEDFFSFAEEAPAMESFAASETDAFGSESEDMVPGLETTEEFLASAAAPLAVVEENIELQPPPVALVPEAEQQLAPEEERAPELNVPSATVAVALSPSTGEVTLSDAQLTALVSRISRDILEKIAWEVVPDLAETIIREEIRKIKEGQ